ncbi:MAG: hypothetical protein MZU95_16170 [Desulfomicrobium escambiense]|nr:hypothetical protein [Desulfomicrobium escambiense]
MAQLLTTLTAAPATCGSSCTMAVRRSVSSSAISTRMGAAATGSMGSGIVGTHRRFSSPIA